MGEELVCEETKVEQLAQELEKKAALKIEEEKTETGDLDAARDESSEKTQQTEQALLNDDLRHPLDNSWDFWYLSADKTKEWDERMTKIMTFSTVEDFWAVYHHVALPSRLHIGADYMVFKAGIAPKWEDVQNAKGGSWVLETGKKQKEHLDAGWLESLLACIGELFGEHGDSVNGVVVQVRKRADRLQLWTGEVGTDGKEALSIGTHFKKALNLPEHFRIRFQLHTDAMKRRGSTVTARFQL